MLSPNAFGVGLHASRVYSALLLVVALEDLSEAERIVITRNDSGKDVFKHFGPVALAGEALANVYLPQSEQTVGKTAERYAIDLAWQVGGNMFRNYWPTFFKRMGLNRLKVIPNPGGAPTK